MTRPTLVAGEVGLQLLEIIGDPHFDGLFCLESDAKTKPQPTVLNFAATWDSDTRDLKNQTRSITLRREE
jgi:hypothetical protein